MIENVGINCTGCSACASICPKNCISLKEDEEGFLYPVINHKKCISCGRCVKACPVSNQIHRDSASGDIRAFALINIDDDIRKNSSSGGAFSLIASYVLQEGGVVFGAAYDNNFEVHHIAIEKEEEMDLLRGSKYVQSRIEDTYKQAKLFLEQNRLVLFSGTACQTSGLIGFLGKDYDNLLTQDLICHGVPSPLVWRKYLKLRKQLEKSEIEKIFCRDKTYGWHNWHLSIDFKNGVNYKASQFNDMMMISFLRGRCSRKCCYDCKFKQKVRLADFTLADLWGIESIDRTFNDDKGTSVCFVNSEKALSVFDRIKNNARWKEVNIDEVILNNDAMITSEKLTPKRDAFMRKIKKASFDMTFGECVDEMSRGTAIRWTIRRVLGNKLYKKILGR